MRFITTRICGKCKNKVILEQNDFIYYKNKYYHFDCFKNKLIEKKRNSLSIDSAMQLANQLKYDSDNNVFVIDTIDKSHLYQYLQKTYGIVYMPKFIYQKFSDIFNGTYKNIMNGQGIPPCDLLDMWERKQNFLDKTKVWNESKGKVMESLQLIQYDLAIIMSKYDSYLKWKEAQKIKTIDRERIKNEMNDKIDYGKLGNSSNNINNNDDNNGNNNGINISDILDEI
jgi:hypothetical protein